MTRRSSTATIMQAMRILANDIHSGDGVAALAIAEAADRLEEMRRDIAIVLPSISVYVRLCRPNVKAGREFRAAAKRLAKEVA